MSHIIAAGAGTGILGQVRSRRAAPICHHHHLQLFGRFLDEWPRWFDLLWPYTHGGDAINAIAMEIGEYEVLTVVEGVPSF